MYCIIKGKMRVMVFDESANKYRVFPFRKWERMAEEKKSRFRIDF